MHNRTYRYFQGEPLYPFGYGLSYSHVTLSDLQLEKAVAGNPLTLSVSACNDGGRDTDEVVQVYIKDLQSPLAVANHSLCAFTRISLRAGEKRTVSLTLSPAAFQVVDEDGSRKLDSHAFRIYVGLSQPDARSVALTGQAPLQQDISL